MPDSGQFVLGEPLNERNRRSRLRLRTAAELFPEIVDPTLDNDGEPSCSAAAALSARSICKLDPRPTRLGLAGAIVPIRDALLPRRFHQPLDGHRQSSAD
jgi:hypothetical protein